MKYTGYKIVEEVNLERLERLVNQLIHEGWEPYGALTIVPRHDNEIGDGLYQAMVRVERSG